jgi:hypothetical protein
LTIKYAEQKIDEATRRLAVVDSELAQRQWQCCSSTLSRTERKMLRAQTAIVRSQRDHAFRDLMELIDLDEMPVADMGTA